MAAILKVDLKALVQELMNALVTDDTRHAYTPTISPETNMGNYGWQVSLTQYMQEDAMVMAHRVNEQEIDSYSCDLQVHMDVPDCDEPDIAGNQNGEVLYLSNYALEKILSRNECNVTIIISDEEDVG